MKLNHNGAFKVNTTQGQPDNFSKHGSPLSTHRTRTKTLEALDLQTGMESLCRAARATKLCPALLVEDRLPYGIQHGSWHSSEQPGRFFPCASVHKSSKYLGPIAENLISAVLKRERQ